MFSRAAYFGMMTSIWAALPIEAVAGFVFSLYWPSNAKIFDEMAPEGTKNTVQGLGAFNLAVGMSFFHLNFSKYVVLHVRITFGIFFSVHTNSILISGY